MSESESGRNPNRGVRAKLTSLKAWELPKEKSAFAPEGVWSNIDMDPTPPWMRNWGYGTFAAYWFSDLVNATAWQKASSVIILGLDWRNAIGIFVLAAVFLGSAMVINGAIGSTLFVPFPVAVRSSFGYYFARFAVISRVILAFFWFALNTWNGGTAVTVMITAIWPSYAHIKNHVPASEGFTTQSMISYFVFWVIQLPFLLIHPTKLKPLFIAKMIIAPIVGFATLGWAVHKAGKSGALLHQHPTIHGEAFTHAWLFSLNSVIGGYATVAVNIPDFTRYSKKPMAQYVQLPILPLYYVITGLFGVITASCTQAVYGKALWSPFDIANKWESRAARFFVCAGWALIQISSNISANSISGANDLTTLFPRWINIRRGSIICALIGGWCMVPWKILKTGTTFLSFMSGYTVVLGPFTGIMIADFWIVRKKRVDVPALYDPHGRYRYWNGINWRALLTLVLVIPPTLPGLGAAINTKLHVGGIQWIFLVSWIWGVTLSMIIYTLLNHFFPAGETLVPKAILANYDERESSAIEGEVEGGSNKASSIDEELNEKDRTTVLESQ